MKMPDCAVLVWRRLLPLVVVLAALWMIDVVMTEAPAEVSTAGGAPAADGEGRPRLIIFWLDGLSAVEVEEQGIIPRLIARAGTGLRGRARCCADAISVPCLTAMVTGVDRFSLFGMLRNFGSIRIPRGNLFELLRGRGIRAGYVGEPLIGTACGELDWVDIRPRPDDLRAIEDGIEALDAENLDIVIIQLNEPDEIGHRLGPSSPEFAAAMIRLDEAIDGVLSRLGPGDHAAVLGDHGHTADGRHFTGLDVPTFAMFFGPRFSRPLAHPLTIADYGSLWAAVFGVEFGQAGWVRRYLAGEPVSVPAEPPFIPSGRRPLPFFALLIALLGACLLVAVPVDVAGWPGGGRGARLGAGALLLGAAFAAGALHISIWPRLFYGSRPFYTAIGLLAASVGTAALAPLLARARLADDPRRFRLPAALFLVGAILLAMPTVYKYGGTYAATTALLVTTALLGAIRLRGASTPRERAAIVLAVGGFVAVTATIWNPAVRNFAVRWFPVYSETLAGFEGVLAALLAVLAAVLASGGGRQRWFWLAACLGGLGLGALFAVLPARIYVLPCALAVPLLIAAERVPRLEPLAAGVALFALPFLFGVQGQAPGASALPPVAAALCLWPLYGLARPESSSLERAGAILVLAWLALWATMGCRISGIDYAYFFRWLGPDAVVEETWLVNTVLTLFKYLTVPLLGLLLLRRLDWERTAAALAGARELARVKLGLLVAFAAGFNLVAADASPFLIADQTQEAIVWIVLYLLLALFLRRGSGLPLAPRASANA
ncbi:MAG TPA: alkaline phosphatase family protein [Polyangia bacterium]|nr:alkaline phosphatase family protein [Polyangia bacterium]